MLFLIPSLKHSVGVSRIPFCIFFFLVPRRFCTCKPAFSSDTCCTYGRRFSFCLCRDIKENPRPNISARVLVFAYFVCRLCSFLSLFCCIFLVHNAARSSRAFHARYEQSLPFSYIDKMNLSPPQQPFRIRTGQGCRHPWAWTVDRSAPE